MDPAKLAAVQARTWFYRFELPDGSTTASYLGPDIHLIHTSRRAHLRRVIETKVAEPQRLTALDLACHEGYFAIELARHFSSVRGIDLRPDTLAAARLITDAVGVTNIEFLEANLEHFQPDSALCADFVLVYGLIYHLENPIHVLRLASQLCRRHILLETQVFPYEISGRIEDGSYSNQRAVEGVFALAPDYPYAREGGATEVALIPSLNALLFLLGMFGFEKTEVLQVGPEDYEQFRRGARVMVYGCKRAEQPRHTI